MNARHNAVASTRTVLITARSLVTLIAENVRHARLLAIQCARIPSVAAHALSHVDLVRSQAVLLSAHTRSARFPAQYHATIYHAAYDAQRSWLAVINVHLFVASFALTPISAKCVHQMTCSIVKPI